MRSYWAVSYGTMLKLSARQRRVEMIDYYGTTISWVPRIQNSGQAKYKQIALCIEKDIRDGRLKTGFRLPPQRIIAQYLEINHSTVTRAYKICEEKGLIKGITGKGTFVRSTAMIPDEILAHSDNSLIDMGLTLPLAELNPAIQSAMEQIYPLVDYDLALKYSPPEGHVKHRYIGAEWLKEKGIAVNVNNILITSGVQNGLAVLLTALFQKADRLLVDQYTYTGLKSLAKLLGIILVPIASDKDGIEVSDLERSCRRENPKGIYLIADCHNPTGVTLSKERRWSVAQVIEKYDLMLIEDGTFRFCVEARENAPTVSSLVPDKSFYLYGTSKELLPSLRIAYLVAPVAYFDRLKVGINHLTWMASPLAAEIHSLLMSTGAYDAIVDDKNRLLKDRNTLFDRVMASYRTPPSNKAMFRYIYLPSDWNDLLIEHLCRERKIQVFSSHRFSVGTEFHTPGIRVSVSAPRNYAEFERGLMILKDVLESYEHDSSVII